VRVLVTADELRAEPADVLLDVRWQLGRTDGHDQYLAGHLPGAVFVHLETELAAPGSPVEGRHPLPSVQALQSAARRWGVTDGSKVVVHDATGGLAAAWAWWLLRWGGLGDVAIMDGGLAAWTGELETGDVVPAPGDVTLTGGCMPVLTADERVAAAAALGDRFAALGVRPGTTVGVYCGSGVTAAHEVAALATAGIEAALWPGSWSEWSNDPERPVATGPV
jgi:thiosulfate/3-mercaptopyruvate sulfurtransferase